MHEACIVHIAVYQKAYLRDEVMSNCEKIKSVSLAITELNLPKALVSQSENFYCLKFHGNFSETFRVVCTTGRYCSFNANISSCVSP